MIPYFNWMLKLIIFDFRLMLIAHSEHNELIIIGKSISYQLLIVIQINGIDGRSKRRMKNKTKTNMTTTINLKPDRSREYPIAFGTMTMNTTVKRYYGRKMYVLIYKYLSFFDDFVIRTKKNRYQNYIQMHLEENDCKSIRLWLKKITTKTKSIFAKNNQ